MEVKWTECVKSIVWLESLKMIESRLRPRFQEEVPRLHAVSNALCYNSVTSALYIPLSLACRKKSPK